MSDRITYVLLIEDNPGDAALVCQRLEEGRPGAEVRCVERLADGLVRLSEQAPAVVLLDLNLPDSRGAETYRRVIEKAPDVPIVILSGMNDESLALEAMHQGVQDYLLKDGLTSDGLERAIRYAVERQALLRSLEMTRKQQLEFKNQLLSHVSHELRTPLTCIYQFVTILLDGLAGEMSHEQREHLNTILKSVKQLCAMVRNLLDASRAEAGKLRVEPRCVSIAELMQSAVSMMQAGAQQKGVQLEMRAHAALPPAVADPDRILEVLINLLDNAIKFTPAGGRVTVEATPSPCDPEFMCIAVSDTGCGIPAEAQPLVFERLYQDPGAVDRQHKGMGLGLFIARELVKLHRGRIWFASELGKGTAFWFTLPVYSLDKLLMPAITDQGCLRPDVVLVKVRLIASHRFAHASWKEVGQRCLEVLERCVYPDRDVVLPPLAAAGPEQDLFVVASADLYCVEMMMVRMREQLGKQTILKSIEVELSACAVPLPEVDAAVKLEEQVREVARRIARMTQGESGDEGRRSEEESEAGLELQGQLS